MVAGNHEFDGRDLAQAWPALRQHCDALGIRLLQRETAVLPDACGRRIRFVGCTRWSDFDLFGPQRKEHAMRAATYFMKLMDATISGAPFDVDAVREQGLACRRWLHATLCNTPSAGWEATVVATHFAPSLRSADPRYGSAASTASFCNADDDLIPSADLWLHGHLHARHDYVVAHAQGSRGSSVMHVGCSTRRSPKVSIR